VPFQFEPAVADPPAKRTRRAPAIILVVVAIAGILLDRLYAIRLDAWLILAVASSIVWLVVFLLTKRTTGELPAFASTTPAVVFDQVLRRGSIVTLMLGWLALSSAWHHWNWNCRAANHIANFATDHGQLVRVIGKVVQTPWIVKHSDAERAHWQNPEHTILFVECRSIADHESESIDVTGTIRVSIDGVLKSVDLSDVIEIIGDLVLPSEPSNPGDFDQRTYLRTQAVHALVRTNHVESVSVLQRERTLWDWLLYVRGRLRRRAEQLIADHLKSETAPVAQAMLLGTRSQIDDETRRAFRESGMLHVLAISGMNVGLLWTWLWTICRWSGRSARTSIWVVLFALPAYALLTDANPPIVRATVVAVIVAFGQLIGRTGSVGNSLALAGLAVLAWNPSDLFNTGAQLSFLAVFAILHAMNWLSMIREQAQPVDEDAPLRNSLWQQVWPRIRRALIDANVVGLAVWVVTSPLVAKEFHLVSPIGSILTVLLAVPVTLMFWIGYTFLLLGLIWSAAFGWLGIVFDGLLGCFLASVKAGASWNLGHVYVPAPPLWWTIGFYALTIIPVLVAQHRRWGPALSVRGGLTWMVIGLIWGLNQPPHPGVTCTFISVGHGLGVMVEFPNGRTALYDAGGMTGGVSIARTISQTLWSSGRARLDAVIISHADSDHCNGLPELSRIVSPGGLFVHNSFLDWSQQPVATAIDDTIKQGADVRLISAGQALVIDPDVTFRILHPLPEFRSEKDNPNSLVISIEYAGRTIVLTGDLELDGLEQLLSTPRVDTDVLLSPHHGSLKANPPDLARWATPEYLIISTPDASIAGRLIPHFGSETQILTTATYGAIRCHINPDGELRITPFKQRRSR